MKNADEIDKLKFRMFELEIMHVAVGIRLRAFQDLATEIWKAHGMAELTETDIQAELRPRERKAANEVLREYADRSPTMATIVKKLLETEFGPIE